MMHQKKSILFLTYLLWSCAAQLQESREIVDDNAEYENKDDKLEICKYGLIQLIMQTNTRKSRINPIIFFIVTEVIGCFTNSAPQKRDRCLKDSLMTLLPLLKVKKVKIII